MPFYPQFWDLFWLFFLPNFPLSVAFQSTVPVIPKQNDPKEMEVIRNFESGSIISLDSIMCWSCYLESLPKPGVLQMEGNSKASQRLGEF